MLAILPKVTQQASAELGSGYLIQVFFFESLSTLPPNDTCRCFLSSAVNLEDSEAP